MVDELRQGVLRGVGVGVRGRRHLSVCILRLHFDKSSRLRD